MFYYGGLVFNREEGEGSTIFVARFIDNNNQEGISGEPIAYVGTSIVHRIGNAPLVAGRQGRGDDQASRVAARTQRESKEREAKEGERRRDRDAERPGRLNVRAGAEQSGEQMVDKPWMAVDIPRAGAGTCSIGGAGTGIPLQSFPGGRVYMAYALFDGPGEERGRIMLTYSTDCAKTWSPPRVISRVQSADVNGDGVANSIDVDMTRANLGRVLRPGGIHYERRLQQRLQSRRHRSHCVGRGIGRPVPPNPGFSQGATLAIDPLTGALQIAWRQFNDGVVPDAIVTVRSTNGGATVSAPKVVATLGSLRSIHDADLLPNQCVPDAGHRWHRAARTWRGRRAASHPCVNDAGDRRCARRDLDVDKRHDLVGATAGRQPGERWPPDHARAHLRSRASST